MELTKRVIYVLTSWMRQRKKGLLLIKRVIKRNRISVVLTSARNGIGIDTLKDTSVNKWLEKYEFNGAPLHFKQDIEDAFTHSSNPN